MSSTEDSLPNLDPTLFERPSGARFAGVGASTHAPRFLMLYGSLRERSYSKLLTLEADLMEVAKKDPVEYRRIMDARHAAYKAKV